VINITNITCQDNPPWPPAGPAGRPVEPTRRIGSTAGPIGSTAGPIGSTAGPIGSTAGRIGSIAGRIGSTVGLAAAVLLSWLAYIPRRLGDHIFTWNDIDAYWRGWQITKVHGGLGRRYRDPLFDTVAPCPQCQGGGADTKDGRADIPCAPCLGTGRISTEEVR
jgi:hypothetical protein